MIRKIAAALSLAVPLLAMPARAEDAASFPSKQIKIIATIPAGNLGDVVTRLLGEHMSKTLNTPVYNSVQDHRHVLDRREQLRHVVCRRGRILERNAPHLDTRSLVEGTGHQTRESVA
jgi:hypothetical protein